MTTKQETRVRNLDRDHSFQFRCGPDLTCFTECCRQLDLALTPYDVLRLCRALDLSGPEFLERYGVVEAAEDAAFPQVYLGMVDDGRASCPFVGAQGCQVYRDRPGACRTYPLGRGARLGPDGRAEDFYVILNEPHCRGFAEATPQTVNSWLADQELARYNEFNDLTMRILQHPRIREGLRPTAAQAELYLEILYGLAGTDSATPAVGEADDELRLRRAHEQLQDELFPA